MLRLLIMKTLKIIFLMSLISFTFSCNEGIVTEDKQELDSEKVTLRKKYKLSKSTATGWWKWTCKTGDPPKEGWSSTKSGAKDAGKAGCAGGIANVIIDPPYGQINYAEMEYHSIEIEDIFGEVVVHTNETINENEINYWMGVEDYEPIEDARKAVVYLTIFGVYNGGVSVDEILENHNLNPEDFQMLISRNFSEESFIDVNEETGELSWSF